MDVAIAEISWSDEVLKLNQFVEQYDLPQFVKVEEGIYGVSPNDTFSSGQILKLHSLTSERKILCVDEEGNHIHVPYNTQERINVISGNGGTSYELSDLLMLKPKIQIVKTVTHLYIDALYDGDYDIHVEPEEILQLLYNPEKHMTDLDKHVQFKTEVGEVFSIPLTNSARFQTIDEFENVLLSEILLDEPGPVSSICFEFVSKFIPNAGLSKLTCQTIYDDDIIIASCIVNTETAAVFSVQKSINLSVKVALGTLTQDLGYINLCELLHDFPQLEEKLKRSRGNEIYGSFSDVSKVTYMSTNNVADQLEEKLKRSRGNEIYGSFSDVSKVTYMSTNNVADLADNFLYDIPKSQTESGKPQIAVKPRMPVNSISDSSSNSAIKPMVYRATKPKSPKNEVVLSNRKTSTENVDIITKSNTIQPIPDGSHFIKPSIRPVLEVGHFVQPSIQLVPVAGHFIRSDTEIDQSIRHSLPLTNIENTISDATQNYETISDRNQSTSSISYLEHEEVTVNNPTKDMSVEDICNSLANLHLGKHVQLFRDNQIDGLLLCELDAEEMQDLGLNKFEIKKILLFKNGWRPNVM